MADEIGSLKVVIEAEDRASNVISGISAQIGGLGSKSTTAAKGVEGLSSKTKKSAVSLKSVGDSLNNVTKPLQYAALGLTAAGVASAKMAIDFEDSFAGVRKTVDATDTEFKKIKEDIIALSTTGINGRGAIPMTTTELNELAAAGGQLGIQKENLVEFVETIAQLSSATNLAGEAGAQTLAQFMNVANVPQDNIDRLGSAIVDLGNNFATNEAKIADMAMNIGAVSNQMGISTQDTLAYATALSSMGIEAQAGGSAVSRILMDIQTAVSGGGEALSKFADVSGKSADEFAAQWKSDASGAFKDFLDGLSKTEDITATLADLNFNNIYDIQALSRFASEKGIEILTEALQRSNTAWEENTALQEEFDKKNETTASQLKNTKNNIAETARSIGEIMLPSIADASGVVSDISRKLAGMSDTGKKTLVGVSTGVIALGAASKIAATGLSTVGGAIEGWGKLKTTASTGSKIATALTGIGKVAGPAALGIAGVTAATLGMYKAAQVYENYVDDWSRGGEEITTSVRTNIDAVRELNDLQYELNDLDFKINSGDLEGEDLKNAKQRLEEIKKILNEKYNLNIDCDTTQLDEAVEKAKQIQYLETKQGVTELLDYGNSKKKEFDDALEEESTHKGYIKSIGEQIKATENFKGELLLLKDAYDKGKISQDEFYKGINELAEATGNPNFKNTPLQALLEGDGIEKWSKDLNDKLKSNEGELATLQATIAEYKQSMQQLADAGLFEMEMGDIEEGLSHIETGVKNAGLNADEYARAATLIQQGQKDLNSVWQQGGQTLDNYVNQYVSNMKRFGAGADEIIKGAALIRNGFTDISQAASAGALEAVSKDATELARAIGMIPDGKVVKISATGDISVIDEVTGKIEKIKNENISVSVNADGDISIMDLATGEIQKLRANGEINIQVNAEGNIEVLNEAGEKVAEIDGKTGEALITAEDEVAPVVESAKQSIDSIEDKEVIVKVTIPEPEIPEVTIKPTVTPPVVPAPDPEPVISITPTVEPFEVPSAEGEVNYKVGESPKTVDNAKGIADFDLGKHPEKAPDIKGKSNYTGIFPKSAPTIYGKVIYKAVYEKKAKGTQNFEGGLAMVNDQKGISDPRELIIDNGRAFIPQGRDVILPLSKGAKVYTASQTKAIMAGLGIPHYAEGKENSDAFTAARDAWTHTTRIKAVTPTEELEKWVELSGQFKTNLKDAEDIEEEIFSATLNVRDELNELSESYIIDHAEMNDWQSWGDTAIDAFNRVRERENRYVAEGKVTARESNNFLKSLGQDMFDTRIENSRAWLEHETEYNNLSVEEYISGLGRMRDYTEEYYKNNLITAKTYYTTLQELEDMGVDKIREANDEEVQAYLNSANGWYEQRELYEDWDAYNDSPLKYYERFIKQMETFFKEGKIGWDEYNQYVIDNNMNIYRAQLDSYGEMLTAQQAYIDDVNESYSKMMQDEDNRFREYELNRDLAEAARTRSIYEGAVTQRGKEVYQDAVESIEQNNHEWAMLKLQKEQAETVGALRDELELIEKYQKPLLNEMNQAGVDISALAQSIQTNAPAMQNLIKDLIKAVNKLNVSPSVVYGDTNYTITEADASFVGPLMQRSVIALSGR